MKPAVPPTVSPLTLNRLSFYLRCLRRLHEEGVDRISSQNLAQRFHLSAAQIRKDLAHFGEFGIRGVGYDVEQLISRLSTLLGLDRHHRMVIIGMGNLGSAL
ncbi:MAG TPA: redox-sensing transcriptional repressor Rex, partial [Thermoanaerobaculia bacterium]|nr:redox-sensing transcriptional repressor Rex [Thermoanaerobaculia bacterium]